MSTVRLELDEATYEGLQRRAEECHVSIEALLAAVAGLEPEREPVSKEVLDIIERQIRDYAPVFHRLA